MPEGPEVKIIVDGLNKKLKGKILKNILFTDTGKYRDKSPANYQKILEDLPLKIKKIECKGKFIYFSFENGYFMGNCLGMSGIWSGKNQRHVCMKLEFENSPDFYFVDQRHFGNVYFYTTRSELDKKLDTLGPDMLSGDVSLKKFRERLESHKKMIIANALMDQKIVSGVGNYIKSEVLYKSKINPGTTVGKLDDTMFKNLYKSIKDVMEKSYKLQGMSQANYVTVDGERGTFADLLKVYRKDRDPLGNKVLAEKFSSSRTTYWVPVVQIYPNEN